MKGIVVVRQITYSYNIEPTLLLRIPFFKKNNVNNPTYSLFYVKSMTFFYQKFSGFLTPKLVYSSKSNPNMGLSWSVHAYALLIPHPFVGAIEMLSPPSKQVLERVEACFPEVNMFLQVSNLTSVLLTS